MREKTNTNTSSGFQDAVCACSGCGGGTEGKGWNSGLYRGDLKRQQVREQQKHTHSNYSCRYPATPSSSYASLHPFQHAPSAGTTSSGINAERWLTSSWTLLALRAARKRLWCSFCRRRVAAMRSNLSWKIKPEINTSDNVPSSTSHTNNTWLLHAGDVKCHKQIKYSTRYCDE